MKLTTAKNKRQSRAEKVAAGVPPAVEAGILPSGKNRSLGGNTPCYQVAGEATFLPPGGTHRLHVSQDGRRHCFQTRSLAAFTLAEVMVALLFLAIVIPVAVKAISAASLSGEVAARKGAAARIADRVLNESIVLTNWSNGVQSGTVSEGTLDFRWKLSSQTWPQDAMELVTAEVTYQAQGRDYSVTLSTLANSQIQPTQPAQASASMTSR